MNFIIIKNILLEVVSLILVKNVIILEINNYTRQIKKNIAKEIITEID